MIRKIGFLSVGMFLVFLTACTHGVAFTSSVEQPSSPIPTRVIVTPISPVINLPPTAEKILKETLGSFSTASLTPEQDTSGMEAMVQQAKEDLSNRFGIAIDRIDLIQVEPVVWNDASLVCLHVGGEGSHSIIPGFRILLEANGGEFIYHSDSVQKVVLCEVNGFPIELMPDKLIAPKGKPPKCQLTPCP